MLYKNFVDILGEGEYKKNGTDVKPLGIGGGIKMQATHLQSITNKWYAKYNLILD